MNYDYDLFVIGAGSAGVRAARVAAGLGARVAISEDRYLGGTCVNVGCVPKKLFVYASRFAHDMDTAAGYGWQTGPAAFDWSRLLTAKNTEIDRLNGVYKRLLESAGASIINGRSSLIGEHAVRTGDQVHTARYILIATGGLPVIPDIPGREHIISSNDVFFLDRLPDSIVIVGGGYIAVEFAGIFNGLGVKTTLVYRRELFLRGFDHECRRVLAEEIGKSGVSLLFNTRIEKITRSGDLFMLATMNGEELHSGLVLYATGREPNTQGLGLENLGIKLTESGAIRINADYQTNIPSICAIGDVTDRHNLTPVATAEGMAVSNRLFGPNPAPVDYADIPTCIFSQPDYGSVGLTEEQAREQFDQPQVFRTRFRPLKVSLTQSNETTFMKMIVDPVSDRVIGVHVIGPDAGEIIQGVAVAMKAGATKAHFDATIGIHPTSAEELVTMRVPS